VPNSRARNLLLLALPALLACPPEEPPELRPPQVQFPPPKGGTVALANWSLELASAVCSFKERCKDPELVEGFFRNEACLDYVQAASEDELDLAQEVADGRMFWDGTRFGRCVSNLARLDCDAPPPLPCSTGLGARGEGESCAIQEECHEGLFCDDPRRCGGQCRRPLPQGSPCQPSLADSQCEAGTECMNSAECAWEGDSCYRCWPKAEPGQECDNDVEHTEEGCGSSMRCVLKPDHDHTGTCRPGDGSRAGPQRVPAGELCSPKDACGGDTRCRPTEFVDIAGGFVEGECKAAASLSQRCLRVDDASFSACDDSAYCDAEAPFEFGVCVPRHPAGAPCSGKNGLECQLGSFCHPELRSCEPYHHARRGEACGTSSDCYSGACSDQEGICVANSRCDPAQATLLAARPMRTRG
jgi:hypothetical protein